MNESVFPLRHAEGAVPWVKTVLFGRCIKVSACISPFYSASIAMLCSLVISALAEEPTIQVSVKSEDCTNVETNIIRLVLDLKDPHGRDPESIAIVINPTNSWSKFEPVEMPDAQWTPFQPEQKIHLNPNLKRHAIFIGSKRANLPMPSWRRVDVQVTNVNPIIVITNPVQSVTQIGLLQLQGYADSRLEKISCLVEKPDGSLEKHPGFLSDAVWAWPKSRCFDPITTYFQCYDILLEPGTNRLSLRCTDIYGNSTATNFTVFLDTKNDKTPPRIFIETPQPGGEVLFNFFTIYGRVDDPSAKMTGRVWVDGPGTRIENGKYRSDEFHFSTELYRGGMFLHYDLPSIGATNHVTISATDPAGNVTTTNLVFYRSHVSIGLHKKWTLHGAEFTGTINVQDHAVWVNGVRATIHPDGTWAVKTTPNPKAESAPFILKALPLNADTNAAGIQIAL